MRHRRFTHRFRRCSSTRLIAIALACGARSLMAQSSPTGARDSMEARVSAPYRLPLLTMAQPLDGGAVYQDRAIITLRYGAGETDDALDIGSLIVTIDDRDETRNFQIAATQAWGSLGAEASRPAIGAHRVSARICSIRGACATTRATVVVLPPLASGMTVPAEDAAGSPKQTRTKRILGAAIDAARRILGNAM